MHNEDTDTASARRESAMGLLHDIGSRFAASDPLDVVLGRVVSFITSIVGCDSCFVYVLEGTDLVLRASKAPHSDVVGTLKLRVGQGITGWVAKHRQPVAIGAHAWQDARFEAFDDLPEDRFEAFLSVPIISRAKLVGVINVQHREPHHHAEREVQAIATMGFLVGAEIELARLEAKIAELSGRLEEGPMLTQAVMILQRELGISSTEAELTIERQSRQRQKSKREVAEAVVIGEKVRLARENQ